MKCTQKPGIRQICLELSFADFCVCVKGAIVFQINTDNVAHLEQLKFIYKRKTHTHALCDSSQYSHNQLKWTKHDKKLSNNK